jgi:hypothetical protein
MKLQNLDAILHDLRTHLAQLNDSIQTLANEVDAAKAERDPFAAMLFTARKKYRRALETDKKSAKGIERAILASYKEAMEAGFADSIRDWEVLLRLKTRPARKNPLFPGA